MTSTRVARSRAALVDQRDALLRSIEDLDRERAAGDLDQDAYDDLHATYVSRTAEVLRRLEGLGSIPEADGRGGRSGRGFRRYLGRRRVRRIFAIGATVCVVGTVSLVALSLAGVRLAGQGETGGVVIPKPEQVQQDLAQAQVQASGGNVDNAIQLYDAVLRLVPAQQEAMTYKGWLERLTGERSGSAGLVELGDAQLARAAKLAPGYADARGLYGIALLEDGGDKAVARALNEFRAFAVAKNNAAVLAAQGPTMAEAFVSAHQVVPVPLRRYVAGAKVGPTGP